MPVCPDGSGCAEGQGTEGSDYSTTRSTLCPRVDFSTQAAIKRNVSVGNLCPRGRPLLPPHPHPPGPGGRPGRGGSAEALADPPSEHPETAELSPPPRHGAASSGDWGTAAAGIALQSPARSPPPQSWVCREGVAFPLFPALARGSVV